MTNKNAISELRIDTNIDESQEGVKLPSPMKSKSQLICIPCVEEHVTKQFIFKIFCKLQIGYIENIQEYPVKHKEYYKRVVIKVKWNKSENAKYIQKRFEEGHDIKVVYSMPWYWICVLCREPSSPSKKEKRTLSSEKI